MSGELKRLTGKSKILFIVILFLTLVCLSLSRIAFAAVELNLGKQLKLDTTPLDITSSTDGLYIYILHPGEVAVYSILDDKVLSRIPIDKSFDRISYSVQANTLFVSSSSAKTIRSIQLEVVQKFSLAGLAFKGQENAPVTIAVFSDYQ